MMKVRSLICPFLAVGAGILSLGIAIMACPLKTPEWVWAGPVAGGFIVLIFAFGRSGAMAERDRLRNVSPVDD
ncbi:hypothetical protein G6L37_06645 [Agrobacterium rubi]|nr:hypothetical protein [Agrobacterium rubi]NTF25042.1 hypothetical protein [Agrobacterium rubi]